MARELTDVELHNVKQAIDLIRRLRECCPLLKANSAFEGAWDELSKTATSDDEIKSWWKAGDDGAAEEAVTERRLWILWISHIWIRPAALSGDKKLDLAGCDGERILRLAFLMIHESYHVDGWADGKALYSQDLQNLVAILQCLVVPFNGISPPCAELPCIQGLKTFLDARIQETIGIINDTSPWQGFKGQFAKWGLRFVALIPLSFLAVFAWVGAVLALVKLLPVLAVAAILTLIWAILSAIFG